MNFEELKEGIGIGPAVIVLHRNDAFTPDLRENLNLGEWIEIYRYSASVDGAVKDIAVGKIRSTATSFDQWHEVRSFISDGDLGQHALLMLGETAETFDQWIQVLYAAGSKGELADRALEQIGSFERTYEQWLGTFQSSRAGGRLEALAKEKLRATAGTFEQLREVYRLYVLSDFRSGIARDLAGHATKYGQWWFVYELATSDQDKVAALVKLSETASAYVEWIAIYNTATEGSDIRILALERLSGFDLSFKQWNEIRQDADRSSAIWKLAIEKLGSYDLDFARWLRIYNDTSPENCELRPIAFAKLGTFGGLDPWMGIYVNTNSESRLYRLAEEKILEAAEASGEWLRVCQAVPNGNLERIAATKYTESSPTFGDGESGSMFGGWLEIFKSAHPGSELECLVFRKLRDLVQTFDQALEFYDVARRRSEEIEAFALERLCALYPSSSN
jgi:hypothetical protein